MLMSRSLVSSHGVGGIWRARSASVVVYCCPVEAGRLLWLHVVVRQGRHLAVQTPDLTGVLGLVDGSVEDELAHLPVDLAGHEGIGASLVCNTNALDTKLVRNVLKTRFLPQVVKNLSSSRSQRGIVDRLIPTRVLHEVLDIV